MPIYEDFFPEIIEEIKAMAEGLSIDYKDICSFLFSIYAFTFDNKCSAFAFKEEAKEVVKEKIEVSVSNVKVTEEEDPFSNASDASWDEEIENVKEESKEEADNSSDNNNADNNDSNENKEDNYEFDINEDDQYMFGDDDEEEFFFDNESK